MFKEKPDVMQSRLKQVLDTAGELHADKPRVNEDERSASNNSSRNEIKSDSDEKVKKIEAVA